MLTEVKHRQLSHSSVLLGPQLVRQHLQEGGPAHFILVCHLLCQHRSCLDIGLVPQLQAVLLQEPLHVGREVLRVGC